MIRQTKDAYHTTIRRSVTTGWPLRPSRETGTPSTVADPRPAGGPDRGGNSLPWRLGRLLVLFAAVAIPIAFSSCAPESAIKPVGRVAQAPPGAEVVEAAGRFGGTLSYALAGEPNTFNYLAATDARSRLVAYLTTATLLELDPVEQVVKPGVVESYSVGADGREVLLTLREGVRFSDGQPLTADDVVFTFERILDESSRNVMQDLLRIDGEALRVVKVDDRRLRVEGPGGFASIENLLATIPVLPRHRFSSDRARPIEEWWTLGTPPEEMAGLGPFVIVSHEPGVRTELTANLHYWKIDSRGAQLPYLDRVRLYYVEDLNAQALRLLSGQLDFSDQLLRPEDVRLLSRQADLVVEDAGPSGNLTFLWFNLNPPRDESTRLKSQWFANREFRQAISCAVSRSAIVGTVFDGLASEAPAFLSRAHRRWYADGLDRFESDPARARRIFRDAGFTWEERGGELVLLDPGGRRVSFELLTRSGDVLGRIAALLRQDLEDIGIRITIRQEEFRAVISRIMRSQDYDAAMMNLDIPLEPSDMRNLLLSTGSMHVWRPGQTTPATAWEAEIDDLMAALATGRDPVRRVADFRRIQEILAWEVPLVPLVNRNVLVVRRQSLRNIEAAPVFPYAWNGIWKVFKDERGG
jgi:peptide/nickel transport system substrate-binding protein